MKMTETSRRGFWPLQGLKDRVKPPIDSLEPLGTGHIEAREVHLGQRRLGDYAAFADASSLAEIRRLAQPLAGLRVLHLSASPFGSAAAETLAALVPLQRDLGMLAEWRLLHIEGETAWQALYEGVSGGTASGAPLSGSAKGGSRFDVARASADFDAIVVHDPQLITLPEWPRPDESRARWVWRCNLDLRAAQLNLWASLRRDLRPFAATLFSHVHFVPADLMLPHYVVTAPAFDPCSPKSLPLASGVGASLIEGLGIDPSRPIVGQFAPIGQRYASIAALGAYWLAKRDIPGLQLVLADVSVASPEGTALDDGSLAGEAEQVRAAADKDPDIHLLNAQAGLTAVEINALEESVFATLQMAVPRGFGWGLAECQWKGKPAIVGNHGELSEQVGGGDCGFVVQGAPDAAAELVRLHRDPALAAEIGQRARRQLVQNHLITHLLGDYLRFFRYLVEGSLPAGGVL